MNEHRVARFFVDYGVERWLCGLYCTDCLEFDCATLFAKDWRVKTNRGPKTSCCTFNLEAGLHAVPRTV